MVRTLYVCPLWVGGGVFFGGLGFFLGGGLWQWLYMSVVMVPFNG